MLALSVAVTHPATAATPGTTAESLSGTVQSTTGNYLTVLRPGTATGVLAKLVRAANQIAAADYPYVWGGGHGRAGVPTIGTSSRVKGYDCSGAVAAVLVAAGLWPSYYSVPNEAIEIRILARMHLIAQGAGTGTAAVTLYDDPGVHIFMNIDGRFWGTSDGGRGANSKGGAGWLHDGAVDVQNRAFQRYHFVASSLKVTSTAGLPATFTATTTPTLVSDLLSGDQVKVGFQPTATGRLLPKSVLLSGELTASGTVESVTLGGSAFTLETTDGTQLTLANDTGTSLAALAAGDQLTVTYTAKATQGVNTYQARAVTNVSTPVTTTGTTTTTTTGTGLEAVRSR